MGDDIKLRLNNITVAYNDALVIDNLSFSVSEGEFVAILGPSGCGKSTLLNVLSGIITPNRGGFLVDDKPVIGISRHFAYMPQEDLLLPEKTIMDNVTLYGRVNHNLSQAREQAKKEFINFGLSGYENAYPSQLSGGMRQRAAFLRTALCKADILLLDEPFAALDLITRGEMQDWLLNLRQSFHRTTLLVTHDIEEALYLADRIIIFSGLGCNIIEEISLTGVDKSRQWLHESGELKHRIYLILKDANKTVSHNAD